MTAPLTSGKYQCNLLSNAAGAQYVPGSVGMWLDSSDVTYGVSGRPRPASLEFPMPVQIVSGGSSGGGGGSVTQGTTPWVDNISQFGGTAVSIGQQPRAASIPVALASDQAATTITPTTVGTSTTSTPLIAAGAATKRLDFFNVAGSSVVWVTPIGGGVTAAAVGVGYPIQPGGGYSFPGAAVPTNAWAAISASGSNTMTVWAGN